MQYGIILSRDQPMSGLLSAQNSTKSADKYGRDRYHPPAVGAPERLLYSPERSFSPSPRNRPRTTEMGRFETLASAAKYSIRTTGFGAKVIVNETSVERRPGSQGISSFVSDARRQPMDSSRTATLELEPSN
jgi:hypothetical protein